jgi:hypothetical protein
MPTFTLSQRQPPAAVEFPSAEIRFDIDGRGLEPEGLTVIRSELATAGVTDLLVLCGGWSDSDSDLRALYDGLAASIRNVVRREPAFAAHTYGILKVMWPARRWPEVSPRLNLENATAEERSLRNIAALEMEVTSLRGVFSGRQADRHLLKVWQLISTVSESVQAQVSLVEHVRELVRASDEMNPSPKQNEYATRRFLTMHPIRLLESVSDPLPMGPIGRSSRLLEDDDEATEAVPPMRPADCDVFQGIRSLLRYAVAHEMRFRAEALGRLGLRESLLALSRGLQQTRFHLIGHSFGARALLTAVDAPAESSSFIRPKTITVLQGALPENAFAPAADENSPDGIFHAVLAEGKVGGPILVSHSISDETAGIPYAIAGHIAEHCQPGKHIYPDPAGPMALNGATDTGALTVSLTRATTPRWKRGLVVNLNGYGLIGNHTDICKPEIAQAILSAATTTT